MKLVRFNMAKRRRRSGKSKLINRKVLTVLVIMALLVPLMIPVLSRARDRATMKALGAKLEAYVVERLDNRNARAAQNMAVASSFFTREMEYVAGREPWPTPSPSRGQKREMGLVAWGKVRSRIEGMLLNPEVPISGMNEDNYKAILGWALSEEDMKVLEEIRTKHGYWPTLRAQLER